MTTGSLFDFGGNVLDQVAVDRVGGAGDRSYRRWFSECVGCDSLLTLKLHPLDDGELTRRRDKAVFVSGPLEGRPGSRLLIYPLRAPPPAVPSHFCQVTGASGDFSSPTWSPDGRSLACADRRGVWVGRLGSLAGSDCEISRRLVAARGKWPDCGPARR